MIPAELPRLWATILVPEMPPENVDVAVEVFNIEPPVIVSPFTDARPPLLLLPDARMPPLNVEVAVDVLRIEPPVIVRPAEAARLVAPMPPLNVEVAVLVRLSSPED